MIGLCAQRSLGLLTAIATLGSALALQGCSGKVLESSDCGRTSSCGGAFGASGGKADAGSAASGNTNSAAGTGAGAKPNACANNREDADESDVDCGGPSKCERCATNGRCTANSDCETNLCEHNLCAEATCADGIKNQDETDVDCGGSSCQPCPGGTPCLKNADCGGGYCADQVCADHCVSGARESNETDRDCGGGTCKACADKSRCLVASDCQSLVCANKTCLAATCSDQVKNQDESEVDCGGVCSASKRCPADARCNTAADCESGICSAAGKCSADIVVAPGDLLDDFEDGDLALPASPALGGRVGSWYAFSDGTGIGGASVIAMKRAAGSVNGLHATGREFKSWGSGFAVDLNNSASAQTKVAYDAAAYTGITFWARAQSAMTLTVALPDADTDVVGTTCSVCGHHYSKTVEVTTNWQRFTVAFSELVREPLGVPVPTAFKASGVVSLQFRVTIGKYDLDIDDVAFVPAHTP